MKALRPVEILLIETVFYLILWVIHEYFATMLSLILGGIFLLIFLFSLVVEWIEKSKVPKWYFQLMFLSFVAPLLAAVIYFSITGGLSWMKI